MEEERDRTELLPGSSSSAGEYSGEASTDEPELVPQRTSVTYNSNSVGNAEAAVWIRDDTSSCIIVVMTFWFFVSMTLILGVYGTVHLQLGPNSSLLIQPNPLFVDHITVEQVNNGFAGPMLYDFVSKPPLDVVSTWSETRKTVLHANSHKELIYYLNMGSQVNISYRVDSRSSSLILIIAQGSEGFAQWIEDPSYPNTTLAWKMIHGNGLLQQNITKSSTYYVAVANLNPELVEVDLNLSVRAFAYDTSEAYYKCTLARGQCSMKLFFPNGNAAVLTTPGIEQGISEDGWYVRLSYGPRWITYLTGTVGMTALMLVALHFLNKFGCLHDGQPGMPNEVGSERAPLLSRKDNDVSSWGSSDDCLSEDEDLEGLVSLDGKPLKDGENNSNMRRLCAICFDAPRDSFFLPCGHCVACFACGTRIAEAAGTCPICRRNMKKVRRIYTV